MLNLYHGTNMAFDKFSKEMARLANDFYGGGVAYLSDSKPVAVTYAKSMVKTKKSGAPTILFVTCNFKKDLENMSSVENDEEARRKTEEAWRAVNEPISREVFEAITAPLKRKFTIKEG